MSLTKQIMDGVDTAWVSLGDLIKTVTYTPPPGAYSPAAGTLTAGTPLTASVAIVEYKSHERDGTDVVAGDRQIIFKARGLGFVPEVNGTVIDGTEVYSLKNVDPDPAGATYIAQGRR